MQYDAIQGDTDDGMGAYGSYRIKLPEPMSILVDASYTTGDFDIAAGSGSYSSLAIGAAIMFEHDLGTWTAYGGTGGANHFNDFDNLEYGNKLSMVVFGGARVPLNERLGADFSLRYRTLRVDADDADAEPNLIKMDAWVFRLGVTYDI